MICTVCWGKGWTRGDGGEKVTCPACHGSGKVEQTNEEWLKSMKTEELAEWLVELTLRCFKCGLNVNNRALCPFAMCVDKGFAMEWLKEKHNGL